MSHLLAQLARRSRPHDVRADPTTKYGNDDKVYMFDAVDMRNMARVLKRLYEERALKGDERRDLANTLDAIMGRAVEVDDAERT